MEDIERANMVLRRIGEMPYFDPEAIVKVLVNEFALIRKESAQQGFAPDVCPMCRGSKVVFDGVLRQCRTCNGTGKRR